MTRSQIRELISEKTRWYGRGFSYECYINGSHVGGSQDLRKNANEGDEVRIEVFKNQFVAGRIRFQVEKSEISGTSSAKKSIHTRPRDSQKSKLYTWEKLDVFRDGWRKNQVESEERAEKFVKGICEDFGFEDSVPSVRHHSGRKKCEYYPREDEIRIGGWGFSKEILVHETVHAILEKLGLNKLVASHGPAFTTLFMEALSKILGYSIEEMKEKADRRELDYFESFDAEKWKNKEELSAEEIGKLRGETYHTKRGETFTQSQLQAIEDIRNENQPDGRSLQALKRRGYVEKENGNFKLHEEKLLI